MTDKDKLQNSCDVETGLCTPNALASQQTTAVPAKEQAGSLKLTYYFDPLCGWCYGFSPVVSKLKEVYGDQLTIEVVSGGLFLGDRAGSVNEVAPHIKAGAYKQVEAMTGVKFGTPFLDDVFGEGKMTLNSLPPTIALCIVRTHFPDQELAFAEMLLHAVYHDGMDPVDIEGYAVYAEKVGFAREVFIAKMREPQYKIMAEKEFEKFRASPYSGMPALVLETEEGPVALSRGYVGFDELRGRIID